MALQPILGTMLSSATLGGTPDILSLGSVTEWMTHTLVFSIQKFLAGGILNQLAAITFIVFGLCFTAALLTYLSCQEYRSKGFLFTLKNAYQLIMAAPDDAIGGDQNKSVTLVKHSLFLANILLISVLTGFFAAAVTKLFEDYAYGNNDVLVRNHIVIASDGWSDQIVPVVKSLHKMAMEPGSHPTLGKPIVVLSPISNRESRELIDETLQKSGLIPNALVRSGNSLTLPDLEKAGVHRAARVLFFSSRDGGNAGNGMTAEKKASIITQSEMLRLARSGAAGSAAGQPAAVLLLPGAARLLLPQPRRPARSPLVSFSRSAAPTVMRCLVLPRPRRRPKRMAASREAGLHGCARLFSCTRDSLVAPQREARRTRCLLGPVPEEHVCGSRNERD